MFRKKKKKDFQQHSTNVCLLRPELQVPIFQISSTLANVLGTVLCQCHQLLQSGLEPVAWKVTEWIPWHVVQDAGMKRNPTSVNATSKCNMSTKTMFPLELYSVVTGFCLFW